MKILICDDHKIVREGLRKILQQLEGVTEINEAKDNDEVISHLLNDIYDILILDISLPGKNGLEVLQSVKERWPITNVLILSMHSEEQYAIRALKFGASGYLTKDTASEELLYAIQRISAGEKYISQKMAESLSHYFDKDIDRMKHEYLSNREFLILIGIANGKSLQKIGDELCISVKTVGTYRSRIMQKMKFTKNTELTRYCLENELIL